MKNGCNIRSVNIEPCPPKDRLGTRISFSRGICNSKNGNPRGVEGKVGGVGRRYLWSVTAEWWAWRPLYQPDISVRSHCPEPAGQSHWDGGWLFLAMIPATNYGGSRWPFCRWVITEREGLRAGVPAARTCLFPRLTLPGTWSPSRLPRLVNWEQRSGALAVSCHLEASRAMCWWWWWWGLLWLLGAFFLCAKYKHMHNQSICKHWGRRYRVVFKVLGSTVGLSSNPVVLSIPCGFGQVTQSLCGSVSQLEKWGWK